MPRHHAEDWSPHRTLSGEGPRPLHHGDRKTGFSHESTEGDCSSTSDSGDDLLCRSDVLLIGVFTFCSVPVLLLAGLGHSRHSEGAPSLRDREEWGEAAGAGTENSHQDCHSPSRRPQRQHPHHRHQRRHRESPA